MSKIWDAVIIGGGAAGLFCAGVAGQLGKKVLVLDHAEVLGEKIVIPPIFFLSIQIFLKVLLQDTPPMNLSN